MQKLLFMLTSFFLLYKASGDDNKCYGSLDAYIKRIFKDYSFSLGASDLMDLIDIRSSCAPKSDERVYFAAYLRSHIDVFIGVYGKPVIFNDVVTNKGGNYNPKTGEFMAPRSGGYYFSWEFLVFPNATVTLELQKNNNFFAHGTALGPYTHYQISSKSTIMDLVKGDTVRVAIYTGSGQLHGTHRYTGFSGFNL